MRDLLYYQGMFCYIAGHVLLPCFDGPPPEPTTAPCRAVHERYVTEPLFIDDLETQGYSRMRDAGDGPGPLRVGFYRWEALR